MTVHCKMNLQWFPFDVQNCSFGIFAGKIKISYLKKKIEFTFFADIKSGQTRLRVEENFAEKTLDSSNWKVTFEPGHEFQIESNVRDEENDKDTRKLFLFIL